MKKILLPLTLLLLSTHIFAGTQTGTVTDIVVRQNDGLHYFYMSGNSKNRPSCANGHTYWMIKDENSNIGKAQLSMLLTAYSSGKTISVIGSGACTRWGDGEDVNEIHLK